MDSALLAVEVYNKPRVSFRSGGYVVLMCIAWTALFHAIFVTRGIRPCYRKRNPRHYERLDGDLKYWELAECLVQFYGPNYRATQANLRFFIGLRNKIEHRSYPALDHRIFGECQALLFNFESLLKLQYGEKWALDATLTLPLQLSRLRSAEKDKSVRELHRPMAKHLEKYLSEFRSSLSPEIVRDLEYSYKVFLIPKLANHNSPDALAVEFVPFDGKSGDNYERLTAIIKPKEVSVANVGRFKPSYVANEVQQRIQAIPELSSAKFNGSSHHARACEHFAVRPSRKSGLPRSRCDTKFCVYDELHDDYGFTQDWIDHLVREIPSVEAYERITGMKLSRIAARH